MTSLSTTRCCNFICFVKEEKLTILCKRSRTSHSSQWLGRLAAWLSVATKAEQDCACFHVFFFFFFRAKQTLSRCNNQQAAQHHRVTTSTREKWDHTKQIWDCGKRNVSQLRTKPAAAVCLNYSLTLSLIYTCIRFSITHSHTFTHSLRLSLTHSLFAFLAGRDECRCCWLEVKQKKISYLFQDYPAFPALLRGSAAGGNVPR